MRQRRLFFGLVLLLSIFVPAASAQQGRDVPAAPQSSSPSGANPTAQSAREEELLRQMRKVEGRVTIPDPKAAVLEQPQGRGYQYFHEHVLPWIMGVLIIAMVVALALFYFIRGPITLQERESGVKIKRFNLLERFTHWTTATCFIVLAVTGLNYVFGKRLLLPLMGPDNFAAWSQWAKFAHNAAAWPFIVGLLLMIVLWVRDNLPTRYDWEWIRQLGGLVSGHEPPAGRFNAGQKLIYWAVVIFGLLLSATGVIMLLPFSWLDINGMQLAQYLHASAAAILIAVIIAHIYIGTLGMQGAFEAMETGEVDLAWARVHHRLWVEEELPRRQAVHSARAAYPAE